MPALSPTDQQTEQQPPAGHLLAVVAYEAAILWSNFLHIGQNLTSQSVSCILKRYRPA